MKIKIISTTYKNKDMLEKYGYILNAYNLTINKKCSDALYIEITKFSQLVELSKIIQKEIVINAIEDECIFVEIYDGYRE